MTTTIGQFRKYDHLERLGHPEVRDLDVGTIYVFPKLDGTNASVWANGDHVQAASRNRVISLESDNHGFCAWVHSDDPVAINLRQLALENPHLVFYGEWLVPHSLRTYREDAWRRFYVFDVYDHNKGRYLAYEEYVEPLYEAGQAVIEPLVTMENPSENQLRECTERNTYLIREGAGSGEGVVLKNYAWRNKFGRQPWAKIVRNEFKEANARIFGVPHVHGEKQVEAEVVNELATEAFVRKTFRKVVHLVAHEAVEAGAEQADLLRQDENGLDVYDEFIQAMRHKIIPRFLGTIFHEFVVEEIWTIVKKHKNPVVDFGKLNKLLTIRAKAIMQEVF